MRRSISIIVTVAALGGLAGATVIIWRRNPRVGTTFVNSVVNPRLLRRGLAGGGASEIGTLEHVGRRSGVRRLTPVHPEPTPEGFRVVVPLGPDSQWARNVLAAGHCRLQLHDRVYDLDEPTMIPASEAEDLPGQCGVSWRRSGSSTSGCERSPLSPAVSSRRKRTRPAPSSRAPVRHPPGTGPRGRAGVVDALTKSCSPPFVLALRLRGPKWRNRQTRRT